MNPFPVARIDTSALRHNLQRVRSAAPNSKVLAVVKANAYGHGASRVVKALREADGFGVARVAEALALREEGVGPPILVLEGCSGPEELALASQARCDLVVHEPEQLRILETTPVHRPVNVWLKVDTGMHRLGFRPEDVPAAWQRLCDSGALAGVPRLMTHLACADDRANSYTNEQWAQFEPLLHRYGAEGSVANSGAVLGWPATHCDWVRPGIMLYGASPFLDSRGEADGLRPVMGLYSRLIAVTRHLKGDPIGYGCTWRCPETMRIGVVAIGYGDGYPRHAVSGTPVLINGRRLPLVGRVSMDMIAVDLRGCPEARVADTVTLWGPGLPVEDVAEHAGTISYELLCGVSARVSFSESSGAD